MSSLDALRRALGTFTPDGAASAIKDGTTNTNSPYLKIFPYLGTPAGGYQTLPGTPKV
jgi:hypothetical protein